jgi:hypothetical protein
MTLSLLNKYELQVETPNRTITIQIQRPNLDYIDQYIKNLVGENITYDIKYIKQI